MRIAWFVLLTASLAVAEGPAHPNCALPQQKQFDFWLGDWDLTSPGEKPEEVLHHSNSIKRILGGCIIQETFQSGGESPLIGTSVSVFDPVAGKWKQTWVDNDGSYLDFVGEFKDGQMVLARDGVRPDGTPVKQRMVFKNISANEFDWSWEASTDGGKTWKVQWPIHYKRKL